MSRRTYRFRNFHITPDLSPTAEPITHTVQCAACDETGPEASTSDSACAWIVVHLKAEPAHRRYRERISRPYRADPAGWQ